MTPPQRGMSEEHLPADQQIDFLSVNAEGRNCQVL
jgi:hypothetical protein